MRRIILLSALLILTGPAFAGDASDIPELGAAGSPLKARHQTALVFPSGKKITVDVVDTPEERERGLMFRKSLPKNYGMLFAFPRQQGMNFWMKNTWVSLDIVFIGADKRITRVHKRLRASTEKTTDEEVVRAGGLAQYVLELPAGFADRQRLGEGQTLQFNVRVPSR